MMLFKLELIACDADVVREVVLSVMSSVVRLVVPSVAGLKDACSPPYG